MKTLSAFVLAVMLAACGSSSVTEPIVVPGPIVVTGYTWNLASVDGQGLPVTLLAATGSSCGVDVRGGGYILKPDGSYTGEKKYGTVVGGVMTCDASYLEAGTYTATATSLTLTTGAGFTRRIPISGNTLSETSQGHVYAYSK